LKTGTIVAAGGADTQCGLLGMGIYEVQKLGIVAGSTTPVMLTTDKPLMDSKNRTWCGLTLISGQFVVESNAGSMGTTLEMMGKMLYAESRNPLTALNAEAQKIKAGQCTVISSAGAQVFNGSAISIPVDSITLSSMGVTPGPSVRMQVARGILEGMAFSVRANYAQIYEVAKTTPTQVYVGGGMTRSKLWTQIVADVLGLPVTVSSVTHASGFGAALCASVGAGLYKDLASAAKALVKTLRTHEPNVEAVSTYKDVFETWDTVRIQRSDSDAMTAGHILQSMAIPSGSKGSKLSSFFRPRIYVSADLGEDSIALLNEIGEVTYKNYLVEGQILSGDEMVQALQGYDVFVAELDIVDAEVLSKLPNLRLVIVCRGNPVNIDIPACSAASIPVINTPGRNSDAVADLTLTYMLMLARRMVESSSFLHEPGNEAGDMGRMTQAYIGLRGDELWHKTVGMVGCGAVGRKVIDRLLPFGVKILVADPYLDDDQIALLGAKKVQLDELYAQSDFISLHAAVTPETTEMINAEAFAKMKEGAFFINTARAALVENNALIQALQSGKLGGAGLDVFADEPPASDDLLLALPNVIATPHIGGNTNQIGSHQGYIIVDEMKRLMSGERPHFVLNPASIDTFSWTGDRKIDLDTLLERKSSPGPGMRDLDVKIKADTNTEPAGTQSESSGLLKSIKKLFGSVDSNKKEIEGTPMISTSETSSSDQFEKLLTKFLAKMESDAGIVGFSTGKTITYQFTIKELANTFYMSFNNGTVKAGFGEPPVSADVKLKMSSEVLVGIITNTVNATKAAMSGKLSFSGDTAKALTLQKLNLNDVYQQACNELGVTGAPPSTSSAPAAQINMPVNSTTPIIVSSAVSDQSARYSALIEKFIVYLEKEPESAEFAKGKNVTFLFTLKETNQIFFFSFIDGVVKTGLGEPANAPDIKIKMPCLSFDNIVTGKLGVTKAAMSGKLSYSGDTTKALAIQKLNMNKAYQKAIAELGDPGDLGMISEIGSVAAIKTISPASPVLPNSVPTSVPAQIRKIGDVRDEILEVLNELFLKGLITATGGNISTRVEGKPKEVWITPSGIFKGDLRPEMMVHIDLEGGTIGEAEYSASSERNVHCAIYRQRPEVQAIIHTHAPFATLMGISNTKFKPISTEAAYLGDVPVVPFIMPGTLELSREVAKAVGQIGIAVVMQNHGLVVCGTTLRRAADMTEVVEQSAEKIIYCRMMNTEPVVLPEDAVKSLAEMGSMLA